MSLYLIPSGSTILKHLKFTSPVAQRQHFPCYVSLAHRRSESGARPKRNTFLRPAQLRARFKYRFGKRTSTHRYMNEMKWNRMERNE